MLEPFEPFAPSCFTAFKASFFARIGLKINLRADRREEIVHLTAVQNVRKQKREHTEICQQRGDKQPAELTRVKHDHAQKQQHSERRSGDQDELRICPKRHERVAQIPFSFQSIHHTFEKPGDGVSPTPGKL